MRAPIPALIASHLAVAGGTYALVHREPPPGPVVKEGGYFGTDTTTVLATTVDSLREERKLLVFSYKGSATVEADRQQFWLFRGHQRLIVPAAVGYYLDMANLTLADVRFDSASKVVTVRLPPLTIGDIAFQPESATTINGGILTYGEGTVEALRKLNYAAARRAMVAQSRQPGLLNEARRQAVADVQAYFEIPLRIAGLPDVRVVATFG